MESPKQYGDAKITPKDAHPELTDHGFRSTFRDRTAERTTYPAEVAEMANNVRHAPTVARSDTEL